jgi:flagellar basal body-associated protein FliL
MNGAVNPTRNAASSVRVGSAAPARELVIDCDAIAGALGPAPVIRRRLTPVVPTEVTHRIHTAPPPATPAPKRRAPRPAEPKQRFLPVLLVLNLVVGVALFSFAVGKRLSDGTLSIPGVRAAAAHTAVVTSDPTLVRLEEIAVRVRGPNGVSHLRAVFELEIAHPQYRAEVLRRMAPLRDAIISYLSDRLPNELAGSEGLAQAKREILALLQALVPGAHLRAVYIDQLFVS